MIPTNRRPTPKQISCKMCGEAFQLIAGKPGFANICYECTEANPVREPERPLAEVAWSGKHTIEINIRTHDTYKAVAFNRANRRSAGFNACLPFSSKESTAGREAAGVEVVGHAYSTNLGEKRVVR